MRHKNISVYPVRKRKKWLKPEDAFRIGRKELQEKVNDFLAAGGKIEKIESVDKSQNKNMAPTANKADSFLRNHDEIVTVNCGVKHNLY